MTRDEFKQSNTPSRGDVTFVAGVGVAIVAAAVFLTAHFIAGESFFEARVEEIGR